jgi:hypothetical protein
MDGFPVQKRATAKRLKQARNGTEQGGFTAAVRPNQDGHFLLRDRKGNIINDDFF